VTQIRGRVHMNFRTVDAGSHWPADPYDAGPPLINELRIPNEWEKSGQSNDSELRYLSEIERIDGVDYNLRLLRQPTG